MQQHNRVLLLVSAGVFMSTMDSSMLNVALPSIMSSFGAPLAVTEWVIIIYLLTITVLLLFWGHLSTQYGQGKIYRAGILIFSIGSLFCFLANGIFLLIFFRFIQAVGASMMMAMGPALITATFPRDQLGSGLGKIGIATSLGLMTGPAISGLLISWFHWRAIFLITVPVGLAIYFYERKALTLPGKTISQPESDENPPKFDTFGGMLWVVSVTVSLLVVTHATTICSSNKGNITLLIIGAVFSIAAWSLFAFHESKTVYPLLPLQLFKKRFFSMALLSAMLSFIVLFFILLLIPFYLRSVQQLSPAHTGYVMMALPLCIFFVSPLSGRLYDLIGARLVATTGLGICLVGLVLMTGIKPDTSPLTVAAFMAIVGFGIAMFLSPNSAAALSAVSKKQTGITSGLIATARNMGMLTGTALAGLIFSIYFGHLTGGLDMKDFVPELTPQFMVALKRSFQVASLIAAVGVAASFLRGKG